ncbi:MAG: aspartate dehydrogenase domain-containing protein [Solirubrobacteraceae bacterium]
MGIDALHERRHLWKEVTVTFRKHPKHIYGSSADRPTILHDGPVRDAAIHFPRNVNAMVAAGLATLGLDRTRGVLVADPTLDVALAKVRAVGLDGSSIETTKRQPMTGVSGTEMADAVLRSIALATGGAPGLHFV